ncbi:T9SS type A sorting domain-containing protein [candidate division WOR-3 bacterium]|nr:T9SS type A sorting domain-containing protein [candidate division WOR-3 bacterium]
MNIRKSIKILLWTFSLFLGIIPKTGSSYVPPQSTNTNQYPSVGNAIYKDFNPLGFHVGHAALFYKYENGKRWVFQANGYLVVPPFPLPSGIEEWSEFLGDDDYWGAYTQERIDSVAAEEIIRIAERDCFHVPYAFFYGHYKNPTITDTTDALYSFRCDGLVEYCYEKAFGENNDPAYTEPNQGIVPNDNWKWTYGLLAKAPCSVHAEEHLMCPALQMEWINDESMYNDEHDWASWTGRKGHNSVPDIAILDTVLVFSFGTKKGRKEEPEGLALNKTKESIRIEKIHPFAQLVNAKEHKLYSYRELVSNVPKGYKEIALDNLLKKGDSKGLYTLSNDFEGPFYYFPEGFQVFDEMTRMVPAQTCTLKWFYVWFYNYDTLYQQTKNCWFWVMNDNGGLPDTLIYYLNGDITQSPGEFVCWKIPVSDNLVFNEPFWVGHYETVDGAPTSVMDSTNTPGTDFWWNGSEWVEKDYDYLHAAVVAYGSGGPVDTIGQDLRITNSGRAPLNITDIWTMESWVIEVTPCSLFIFPHDTAIVHVTVDRDTFTTSQTGELNIEHTMNPPWVTWERVGLIMNIGSPAVDTFPPIINISQPNGGEFWKTGEEDTIWWSVYDNDTITHFHIDYSIDGGMSWDSVLHIEYHTSGGWLGCTWDIPDTLSWNCLVRVSAKDRNDNWGSDTSDSSFRISNDTIPPPIPSSLTANGSNPSPWQPNPTFTIDWTNPYDRSGIIGAWYKLSDSPSYPSDGIYTEDKPFEVSVMLEGVQMLYVWLEDSSGNKNHLNNTDIALRYDATPPSPPESLYANGYLVTSPWTNDSLFVIRYVEAGNPYLLISEVCVTPTNGEFVEIYNPLSIPIDLNNFYLFDGIYLNDNDYINIVDGTDTGYYQDFLARFPYGATIMPGEYLTIAMNDSFSTYHAIDPDFELTPNGISDGDSIPDMLNGGAGGIGNNPGLSNNGESVILFHWDWTTDLVYDSDIIVWGDKDEAVNKTGIWKDGPDSGTDSSQYLPDTPIVDQEVVKSNSHSVGKSFQRVDLTEGNEILTGGNGIRGHDETSEDLSITWSYDYEPTPGAGYTKEALLTLTFQSINDWDDKGLVQNSAIPVLNFYETGHFEIGKADTSGIIKAYYKLGNKPYSNGDTTGSDEMNPFNVECSIGGGETLWVWLQDGAGNKDYSNCSSVILRYDITPPEPFNLVSPADSECLNITRPIFTWETSADTFSGLDYYEIYIDNLLKDSTPSTNWTADYDLTEDLHNWYVVAYDSLDNSRQSNQTWTFTIDTQIPDIPMLLFPSDSSIISDNTPGFSWTHVTKGAKLLKSIKGLVGNKNSAITYFLTITLGNDSTVYQTSDTFYTLIDTLVDSVYLWKIQAEDEAGNKSGYSEPFILFIDTQAPEIESTTVWDDTTFTGPFPVSSYIADENGVSNVELWYKTSIDTNWVNISMDTAKSENQYFGEIPQQSENTEVYYYINAQDKATPPNEATDPINAPDSSYCFTVLSSTGITEERAIPKVYFLSQNYPNPFVHTTKIKFGLPKDSYVNIEIYNLSGQGVATLMNERKEAGYYEINWNALDNKGIKVPPGIYFCRLETEDFCKTKKMILLR